MFPLLLSGGANSGTAAITHRYGTSPAGSATARMRPTSDARLHIARVTVTSAVPRTTSWSVIVASPEVSRNRVRSRVNPMVPPQRTTMKTTNMAKASLSAVHDTACVGAVNPTVRPEPVEGLVEGYTERADASAPERSAP